MLRPAFSTVACPSWTLEEVAHAAEEHGYAGVELRTMGSQGGPIVSDPALTAGAKVRRLMDDAGIGFACLATGLRFDEPIIPPVLGHLRGIDNRLVAAGGRAVDTASDGGAEYVRVFGFQRAGREPRKRALNRICARLTRVCQHARHRGLRVVIENGGDFPYAADLAEIIGRVNHPLLMASYDAATAHALDEDPVQGAALLAPRLGVLRVRPLSGGSACPLGEADAPFENVIAALGERGSRAWAVFTWDRLWIPELDPAERVLPDAARTLWSWCVPGDGASAAA